jgi:hypothetical protein
MFEVFIPVSLKITVFWDVTLCHWLLRTAVVLHLQDDPEDEDILILLNERCK